MMRGLNRTRHSQDKQVPTTPRETEAEAVVTMEAEEADRHTALQAEVDRHTILQVEAMVRAQWAIWDQWGTWLQESCSTTKWP